MNKEIVLIIIVYSIIEYSNSNMNTVSPDKNKKRSLFQWSNNHYNNNNNDDDDSNIRNSNKRNDNNNDNNNANANNTINYNDDCNALEVDDVFNGLLLSLDMDGDNNTNYNRSDIMSIDNGNSTGPKRKYRRINDTDRGNYLYKLYQSLIHLIIIHYYRVYM